MSAPIAPSDTTAFDALPCVVLVLDAEGRVLHWNRACDELVGGGLEVARGRPLWDAPFLVDDQAQVALRSAFVRDAAPSPRLLQTWRGADGGRRVLDLRATPLPGVDDRHGGWLLAGVDRDMGADPAIGDGRLRALLEQTIDGVFLAERDGRFVEINDAACHLLARDRADMLGVRFIDLIPADEACRLTSSRAHPPPDTEDDRTWRFRRGDGSTLPVDVRARILPDGRWQMVVRDASERERCVGLERTLRGTIADRDRAQILGKIGSWRLDVTTGELLWSPETHRIFGTDPRSRLDYASFLDHVHPADREIVDAAWRAALRGERYDIDHRIVVGGTVRWVRERADFEFAPDGAVTLAIGVVQDITVQRLAEDEQRRLRERIEAIVAVGADAIISIDADQRIIMFNTAAERIFGWTKDEVLGRPLDLLMPERLRARHRAHIEGFRNEAASSRGMGERGATIVGLRRSGEEFPAEAGIAKSTTGGALIYTAILRDISDRVAREQERERLLAELDSERRWLRTVLEVVPLGILLHQPDGRLYANRRAEEVFGMTFDASAGVDQYAARVLFPDGRPVPPDQLVSARLRDRGEPIIGEEYLIERPDGSRLPILGSGAPLRDSSGRVVGMIGVFQDVSERMRAGEALRLSEERLRLALQAAPTIVFNQDLELRYTWVHNPRLSYRLQEVLGHTDIELMGERDAEPITTVKRRVIASGTGERFVMKFGGRGEGRAYDLVIEPLRNVSGAIIGVTGAAWEVTERLREEDEQRFLADIGGVLVSAAPHLDATLTEVGRALVRDFADWCLIDLVEGERVRRVRAVCADRRQDEIAIALEHWIIDPRRPDLTAEVVRTRRPSLTAAVDPAYLATIAQGPEHLRLLEAVGMRSALAVPLIARGSLIGALSLLSTRADRRYREQDLRLAEAVAHTIAGAIEAAQLYETSQRAIAARQEILGIVAHDLRSPLWQTVSYAKMLRDRHGENWQTVADAIARAGARMDRLIRDMLDVARLESGAFTVSTRPMDVGDLLEQAVASCRLSAADAGIELRLHRPAALPIVLVDADRFLQVLDNLIGNAIKFTPRGGRIEVGAEAHDDEVQFSVADTGSGIAPELVARLFDRFWQGDRRDRRGAGLGLAIVKGIVEAHGGRVGVESRVGEGTTFRFSVPTLSRSGAASVPPPSLHA